MAKDDNRTRMTAEARALENSMRMSDETKVAGEAGVAVRKADDEEEARANAEIEALAEQEARVAALARERAERKAKAKADGERRAAEEGQTRRSFESQSEKGCECRPPAGTPATSPTEAMRLRKPPPSIRTGSVGHDDPASPTAWQ